MLEGNKKLYDLVRLMIVFDILYNYLNKLIIDHRLVDRMSYGN